MSFLLSLYPFQILMLLFHSVKQLKVSCSSTLKKSISAKAAISFNSLKIYDGMVHFQRLPPDLVTFKDISDYILNKIM